MPQHSDSISYTYLVSNLSFSYLHTAVKRRWCVEGPALTYVSEFQFLLCGITRTSTCKTALRKNELFTWAVHSAATTLCMFNICELFVFWLLSSSIHSFIRLFTHWLQTYLLIITMSRSVIGALGIPVACIPVKKKENEHINTQNMLDSDDVYKGKNLAWCVREWPGKKNTLASVIRSY